jgi:hypothetical protein
MKLIDVINEQDDDNLKPITAKDRKKVRAVYTAFRSGIINKNEKGTLPKLRYQLANHYMIKRSVNANQNLVIVLVGKSFENVTIHVINDDGSEINVTPFSKMWNGYLWVVGRRVEELFKRYNIDFELNFY